MQIANQVLARSSQNQHGDTEDEYDQVDSFREGECLSETSANLLSRTGSNEVSTELTAHDLCSPQIQRRINGNELENCQNSQGARPTSLSSLTLNSCTSPSSGNSAPTSSDESAANSITGYIVTAVQSTYNSASSALAMRATSTAGSNRDQHAPAKTLFNGESCVHEAASIPEGLSTDVSAVDEDEGNALPREIHPADVQLARMLAAVSQTANASPAQLLQIILNFAPEDYQDLVSALVESRCSCVHLLAYHLHNLRTMAEEAIDDSLPAAVATADGKEAINATGMDSSGHGNDVEGGQTVVAKPSSKPLPADSSIGKKIKATGSPVQVGREVEREDTVAQEALRASIMDQYSRVVYRLVQTALSLLNTDTQAVSVTAQKPPLPPPPTVPNGRGGGCGGGHGRIRAEQLSRSRSVPNPSSVAIQTPPPPPSPGGHVQRSVAQGSTACRNHPQVSAAMASPRAAGSGSASPQSLLGTPTPAYSAFSPSASASGLARAATTHGYILGNAKQVTCQRLGSVPAGVGSVEALGVLGFNAAAPRKQRLSVFSLGPNRGRCLSQAAMLLPADSMQPVAGTAARRGQGARVGSYVIDGEGPGVPQMLSMSTGWQSVGTLAETHTVLGTELRGMAVRSLPTQGLGISYSPPEQSRTATSLLHQQQQQQQVNQIQQQLLFQQLLQVQQQQRQQQLHCQQQMQNLHDQQMQMQQLQQQLELSELLAASNGGLGIAMPVLSSPDVTQSAWAATQVDVLGLTAAAAQLMQTYSGTNPLREPAVWPTVDPLDALQWQLPAASASQNSLGIPRTGDLTPQLIIAANQQHKQQLLLLAQGGLPPTGTAVVHTRAKSAY